MKLLGIVLILDQKYKQEVKLLNPEQYNIDELYWFSSYDGEQTQEVGLKSQIN